MERIHIYEDLDWTVWVLNKEPDFEVMYKTYADLHKDQIDAIVRWDLTLARKIMAEYKEPRLDL